MMVSCMVCTPTKKKPTKEAMNSVVVRGMLLKEWCSKMAKKKKIDRRIFKKEGEELQQWLAFRKRGSKVESKKRYNRQKAKRGEM